MASIAIGRRVYGLGAIALGTLEWVYAAITPEWLPLPAPMAGNAILVHVIATLLILGGLAINLPRVGAIGALAVAAVFAAGLLILELPPALAKPETWGQWEPIAESTAMALGGVLAYSLTPGLVAYRAADFARVVFAACLVVFGISHFVYLKYTATLVPAWLPPSRVVWAGLTGVAQIVAGAAIFVAVQARLAAILLTVMYAVFGLLVHLPIVMAKPIHANWAESAINFTLMGAAWALADWLEKGKAPL